MIPGRNGLDGMIPGQPRGPLRWRSSPGLMEVLMEESSVTQGGFPHGHVADYRREPRRSSWRLVLQQDPLAVWLKTCKYLI